MTIITMTTATAAAAAPAMIATFGALGSPGLVVVVMTVGTGSDTAVTLTPNNCAHNHDITGQQRLYAIYDHNAILRRIG